MALHQETITIEDSKAVDDVGTEAVVNILRVKLASARLPGDYIISHLWSLMHYGPVYL